MNIRTSAYYIFLITLVAAVFVTSAKQMESPAPTTDVPDHEVHWTPALNDGTNYWIGQLLPPRTSREDLRHKPFFYWRAWASKPLPVVPTFLFVFLTNTLACFIFPRTVIATRQVCRSSFWQSLLIGLTIIGTCLLLARCLFLTGIGNPLGMVLLGTEEAGLLFGLAVTSTLSGRRLISLFGLTHAMQGADMRMLVECFVGAVIVTLLNLVPGIGVLPPLGLRLTALLAMLGMGATFLRLRSLGSSSLRE
jgi:hypothetical protein